MSNTPARVPDPNLGGRVAIVTGGGRGLGAALTRHFAAAGAAVVLAGRNEDALVRTAGEVHAAGGQAEPVRADVSQPEDVERVFAHALEAFGGAHILVNNAGIAGPTAELPDVRPEDWNEVFAVNVTGVFLCCRAAIPLMRETGGGKIVNIGSISGKRPLPMRTPYTTSKLALVGLTRTLAHEVAQDRINVNTISPGFITGERLDLVIERMAKARGTDPEAVRAEITSISPFGRAVSPDEVATVALFLCTPAADAMTGQDINVTAGAVMY